MFRKHATDDELRTILSEFGFFEGIHFILSQFGIIPKEAHKGEKISKILNVEGYQTNYNPKDNVVSFGEPIRFVFEKNNAKKRQQSLDKALAPLKTKAALGDKAAKDALSSKEKDKLKEEFDVIKRVTLLEGSPINLPLANLDQPWKLGSNNKVITLVKAKDGVYKDYYVGATNDDSEMLKAVCGYRYLHDINNPNCSTIGDRLGYEFRVLGDNANG